MSTSGTNGEHRATIREIASAAGVSIATVSRVLNERPGVAEETRGAVLRVVRDRGFTANRSARALSGGRTGLIGVMLPIVEATYFMSILSGAAEALYEQDMRMVLCPTLHHHEREVTLLDRLMHGTTDGAVLMLPEESNSELKILRRKGYAFVIVDPRVALDEGIPAVSAANASGARAATEHLLSLGHRRIGAITGPQQYLASTERLNGYHGAMAAAGVLPDPAIILESSFGIEGGAMAAGQTAGRAGPADRDLRLQRQHRDRSDARRAGTGPAGSGGHLDRRLRRLGAVRDRLPVVDDRAPAARRDGPHGRQPAAAPARQPAARGAAHRAEDAARRARVDRASTQ